VARLDATVPKLLVLKHVAHEPLGTLDPLLRGSGFRIRYVNFGRDVHLRPSLEGYQGLIVLGGPMNVDQADQYPHLRTEIAAIREALRLDVPVLGICLGAQLLAHELGAEVGPNREGKHEYGYYPLHPTEAGRGLIPDGLMVLQSHYHQFGIPAGADLLASTDLYENQAFRYGATAFGLQFHPEASHRSLKRWIERRGERNFADGAHAPERQLADHAKYDTELGRWFTGFLEHWAAPALARSAAA
jgi:GMP synthase (glutamine-hydrolysing)